MRVLIIALISIFIFQQVKAVGETLPKNATSFISQDDGVLSAPESAPPIIERSTQAAGNSTGGQATGGAVNSAKQTPTVNLTTSPNPSLNASIQSCNEAAKTAHTYCLAQINPKIQTAAGLIGVLLSGAGALKSTSESCQKYNQALKIAEAALTAYNGMCSAGQMSCETACDETKTQLATTKGIVEKKRDAAQAAGPSGTAVYNAAVADLGQISTAEGALVTELSVCKGYKMNLAAAGVGLMNVIKQSTVASTCQGTTTVADCTKDPTNPACVNTTNVDCSKPENQSQTQCICQRAPGTAGCPGATGQNAFAAPSSNSNSLSGNSAEKLPTPNFNGTDSSLPSPTGGASAGGAGLAGGGSGGGGGGGLGSGGQNAKAGTADGKKEKGMNTNILSGYDGGGGGGGGSRGGGYNASNSAYNAYLPGGAKDPTRGLASQTFGNGQVTGAGSKSNWEKISERYKDSKPTLIGP
jgi:hypothetical protein